MPSHSKLVALPPELVTLLASIWPIVKRHEDQIRDLDLVEFHAGRRALTTAVCDAGFRAVGIDKEEPKFNFIL